MAGGGANDGVAGNIIVGAEAFIDGETNRDGSAGNMANQVIGGAKNEHTDMMHELGAIMKV